MLLADEGKYRLLYQTAVEESRLAVWEYDVKSKTITLADNQYTKLYYNDLNLPDVITDVPNAFLSLIDEKSVNDFIDMFESIDGGASRAECTVCYKSGATNQGRYEHILMTTVYDDEGQPVSAIGISDDITAKVNERARFEDLNKLFDSTIHNSLVSARMDLTSNTLLTMRSIFPQIENRYQAATAEELLNKVAEDIADGQTKENFLKEYSVSSLLRHFDEGHKQFSVDFPIIGFEGEYKWISGNGSMRANPMTGHVETIVWAEDITNGKNMNLIMSRLIAVAIRYISIVSVRTRKLTVLSSSGNGDEKSMVGHTVLYEEGMAQKCKECVVPEEREFFMNHVKLGRIEQELSAGKDYKIPYSAYINGKRCRLQTQYLFLNREFGQIMMVTSDITESYEQERRRIQTMEDALFEAEKANISRLDFIARISHDIRTPMGIISNMSDFALKDIDNKEKLKDDLNKIKSANTFLLSLIDDVLDVSNFENERVKLKEEPYYTKDFLNEIRSIFETLCDERGIRFAIEQKGPDVAVLSDKVRFRQVALNLLNNAVNFTYKGGSISFLLEVTPLDDGKAKIDITVTDSGIGMSESFAKTMFRPFSQEVDNPYRAKNAAGAGLGLYIVKNIINLMNGEIQVKSQLGKGTQIRCSVVFPLITIVQPEGQGKVESTDSGKKEADSQFSGTILLVDDNEINREIAVRILNSIGLDSDEAENGDIAVQKMINAQDGQYRAVLMDIQMPVMNGYEATAAIRSLEKEESKTIPIIALTANAFKDAADKARECGMNDIITKPLEALTLKKVLSKFAEQKVQGWIHDGI